MAVAMATLRPTLLLNPNGVMLAKGDVIPRMGLNEFMRLRIAIPSITKQVQEIERKLIRETYIFLSGLRFG